MLTNTTEDLQMTDLIDFPPLPEPEWVERKGLVYDPSNPDITRSGYNDLFSAQQMCDYVAADRAQRQAEPEPGAPPAIKASQIKVCHIDNESAPFVYWVHGRFTADVICEIEKDIAQNMEEVLCSGFGDYRFNVTKFSSQYGFEGCCEIAPGWEYELIEVKPYADITDARTATNESTT